MVLRELTFHYHDKGEYAKREIGMDYGRRVPETRDPYQKRDPFFSGYFGDRSFDQHLRSTLFGLRR